VKLCIDELGWIMVAKLGGPSSHAFRTQPWKHLRGGTTCHWSILEKPAKAAARAAKRAQGTATRRQARGGEEHVQTQCAHPLSLQTHAGQPPKMTFTSHRNKRGDTLPSTRVFFHLFLWLRIQARQSMVQQTRSKNIPPCPLITKTETRRCKT